MRHPFKDFTRKRGGRVGTRFHGVVASSMHGEIRYDGQLMLADWQEKPGSGMTVKFWLDEESSNHPFAGCTRRKNSSPGEMFAMTMVELTDDEQQEPTTSSHGRKGKTLSQDAHVMVTGPMFVQYLKEMKSHVRSDWSPELARQYVKHVLDVESLSELDHNPAKKEAFHSLIRLPYSDWHGDR